MNTSGVYKKLFIIPTTQQKDDFYKFAMQYIERGEQVLIIARDKQLLLPHLHGYVKNRDMLQMLTIMYPATLQDVAEVFVELNDWKQQPTLFVIDLCDYVENHNSIQLEYQQLLAQQIPFSEDFSDDNTNSTPILPIISYCLSSMVHFANTQHQVQKSKCPQVVNHTINVFILLPNNSEHLTQEQLQLLIDLYFYGHKEVYNNFDELQLNTVYP